MSMRYTEGELSRLRVQEAQKSAERLAKTRARLGDVPILSSGFTTQLEKNEARIEIKAGLELAGADYRSSTHTPEVVTDVWQSLWEQWGRKVGEKVEVPPLEMTRKQIAKAERSGDFFVYVPEVFSTPESSPAMRQVFRGSTAGHFPYIEYSPYTNLYDQHGWLRIESSITAPFTNKILSEMFTEIEASGREPMTVNTYAIASQASRIFTGRNFDADPLGNQSKGTYSILLGSIDNHSESPLHVDRRVSRVGWHGTRTIWDSENPPSGQVGARSVSYK